ncbi:MAG: riboflavin synthase [Actinomycetota bacterium]
MFTGIVTEQGRVTQVADGRAPMRLEIKAPDSSGRLNRGDSVAINGVCLTVVESGRRRFAVEVVDETLARSTLGSLRKGAAVNLELPLRPVDRLGGHFVQGHVDGKGRIRRLEASRGGTRIWVEVDEGLLRYIVSKGSVALDGVSLTVVEVGSVTFQVALIPHTLSETNLGRLEVDDEVNVEVDLLAKYVASLVPASEPEAAAAARGRLFARRRS